MSDESLYRRIEAARDHAVSVWMDQRAKGEAADWEGSYAAQAVAFSAVAECLNVILGDPPLQHWEGV